MEIVNFFILSLVLLYVLDIKIKENVVIIVKYNKGDLIL